LTLSTFKKHCSLLEMISNGINFFFLIVTQSFGSIGLDTFGHFLALKILLPHNQNSNLNLLKYFNTDMLI
jgi:hypothetical protein